MKKLFSDEVMSRAIAKPEEMKYARANGLKFVYRAEGHRITGWNCDGVIYIESMEEIEKVSP